MSHNVADRNRPNSRDRGYDRRWERTSGEYLQRRPWCLGCLAIGVRRKAELVDHIIPHRGDQRLFWNVANWQASCTWHHNSIKAELERLFASGKLRASELQLSSATAVELSKQRHKPAIGPDGYAIAGT